MEAEESIGKKERKRLPVWACILLFVVGFLVCLGVYGSIGLAVLALTMGVDARTPGLMVYIVTEIGMLLSVLTPAVILLYLEGRPFSDLGLTLKGHGRGLWYGLLLAAILYLVGFGLNLLMGDVEVTGFQFDPINLLLTFVFFVLVAVTEEIMTRGYILGRLLHTHLNKFISLLLSAMIFAVMHLFNPNVAFLPMINLVLAGMMLGASYLYTRNLCFPISLHLFWNWFQGPILGYQVSGNELGTSLLTLRLPEENVLNGGAFGFEGSLICTVLMIIFTIGIIWWGEKREAIRLVAPRSC